METKDLSNYLKPEASKDLDIDIGGLSFDIDEAAIEAKRNGGGEAIIPGAEDNNCGSGGCIL